MPVDDYSLWWDVISSCGRYKKRGQRKGSFSLFIASAAADGAVCVLSGLKVAEHTWRVCCTCRAVQVSAANKRSVAAAIRSLVIIPLRTHSGANIPPDC